jgi:hypothetical protein
VQTRAQINKFKTKETVKNEKEKTKENDAKTTKQKIVFNQAKNPQHMTYNVINDLTKLRITLSFMEIVKIPQQRKKILKILDEPSNRIEVVVTNSKQQKNYSSIKPRGKFSSFNITIENHDVVLHNCLVDSGETNNIMLRPVMETLGMGCTKYYETGEINCEIDSRKVQTYGEIKYFCAWITAAPHIAIGFTIIVVDLSPSYGVVLGRDWSSMIGGYIINDESCMMFPNKDGTMVRVHREARKHVSFRKKENELMENYVDAGVGNYVVLSP